MCRLYGFHSTAPRKVECELIASQNSLIAQSERDETGGSHQHGWGMVTYYDGDPYADRQVEPAFRSDRFRWSAAQAYSTTVLAHVRHATVGAVSLENTHPFVRGSFSFIHNGTIAAFASIKDRMLCEMDDEDRASVKGTTDSEHFFNLLISKHRENGRPMAETLRHCCSLVFGWAKEINPEAEFALNTIWTDGKQMVGSRLGRSLWFTRRDEAHVCEICGTNHTRVGQDEPYHAVVLASERLTRGEEWVSIEDGSVFAIEESCEMCVVSL